MRKIVRLLLITVLFAVGGHVRFVAAQTEFEMSLQQQRQSAQKANSEFKEYKDKQDQEFADFLKSRWREFDTFRGKVRIKEPKPKQMPAFVQNHPIVKPATPAPVTPALVPDIQFDPAPSIIALPIQPVMPPAPPQQKPVPVSANVIEIYSFGNPANFSFDPQWMTYRLPGGAKPEAMSTFWTMMSDSKYEPTIQAISDARRTLKLDDWGYVSLWRDVARALQPERKAEQNLLLWYFLIKSGYDVRLGYAESNVHLFIAVKQQVFSTQYTTVGNQIYYAVLAEDRGDSIRSFYTYEASYPNKLKPLDLNHVSTDFSTAIPEKRALIFAYKDESIRLNVTYDRRLVNYMNSFPQLEFPIYFDTAGSTLVRQSLLSELRKYTAKMGEEDAVNFLLAFVQKAFAYKTDDDQFGYEKYLFVEESLFYPYNDCEDRSVLFAWLVHELLGIKTVGLLYPGHMTTAIALKKEKSDFATVDYQGNRFVIADPTYIGASVGMAMLSYAKLKPNRVVEIQF